MLFRSMAGYIRRSLERFRAVLHLDDPPRRIALAPGTWLNLPWFTPLVYSAGLAIGGRIVPDPRGLQGLSVALLVGTTIVGVVDGAAAYVVAFGLIAHRRGRGGSTEGAGSRRRVA